jgi:hypothetical protein
LLCEVEGEAAGGARGPDRFALDEGGREALGSLLRRVEIDGVSDVEGEECAAGALRDGE